MATSSPQGLEEPRKRVKSEWAFEFSLNAKEWECCSVNVGYLFKQVFPMKFAIFKFRAMCSICVLLFKKTDQPHLLGSVKLRQHRWSSKRDSE